jgi:hypothetical protein
MQKNIIYKMKTKFNLFESDKDPLYSHNLRMKKGYKPKYKLGLIAVRFQDDEKSFGEKYQDVDDGELKINYQELFADNKSDFIKHFEEKYDIKMSDYRSGTDDYYFYFKCKTGTEEEKIKEIAKDKIVKVVDYVDARGVENIEKLEEISRDLLEIVDEYGDESTEKMDMKIKNIIKRLQNLL